MFFPRCIWIAILLAAAPVSSATDFWNQISNFRGWKVSRLSVTGVDKKIVSALKDGLELAGKDVSLYEQTVTRDIDRIRLYLARHGYPYSAVTPRAEPAADVKKLRLTLEVSSGPPVLIRRIDLTGIPEHLSEKVVEEIDVQENVIFSDEALESYKLSILDILQREGYARASITSSANWIDTTTVRVRIAADPGAVYYFDNFIIQGAREDLVRLAELVINIDRGERYDPELVRDARDNLTRMGLFRQIKFSMEDSAPDSLDVLVELQERKPRSIEIAGGYWSDEKLSARLRWKHNNLFRRGRGTSVELTYTQFKRHTTWSAWWPALFGAKTLGIISGGYSNLNEESYEKEAPGIGVSFSYVFSRWTAASIGYHIERASYTIKTTEEPLFEDTKGLVGWLSFRISHDGTDDRINPRTGTYSWFRVQWGPPGGVSNTDFILAETSGSIHIPLKYSMLLVANLRLGAGRPLDPSVVLLPDIRFYAGGSTTHRGFNRRKLGPLDENGKPLGGEVMMTSFIEWRFPLVWKLRGALFLDCGQVWRTRDDVNADNIELAVGPAIRFDTPVGPLRFDFGIRLTDHETREPRTVFHFAIGYPM